MTTGTMQLFQIADEIVRLLDLPEKTTVTECLTLDPDRPSIYIGNHRVVGGKPRTGVNVIRERSATTSDILQSLPGDALRKIHAALS